MSLKRSDGVQQSCTLWQPITPLQPESEASVKMTRDGTRGKNEVFFAKNLGFLKGFKASIKEASTGIERSLLDVEVEEFI